MNSSNIEESAASRAILKVKKKYVAEHDDDNKEAYEEHTDIEVSRPALREAVSKLFDNKDTRKRSVKWSSNTLTRFAEGEQVLVYARDIHGNEIRQTTPTRAERRQWARQMRRTGFDPVTGEYRKGQRAKDKQLAKEALFHRRKAEVEERRNGQNNSSLSHSPGV